MNANLLVRFETALAKGAFFGLVREMEAEDLTQVAIYDYFEQFRALLREVEREADENKVMDTMDCIAGWCSPTTRLFEHYLTNQEIAAYRQKRDATTEEG